jgi:sugar O-acyltransferase (sialic acid O-acetyltransferase NeuD family)
MRNIVIVGASGLGREVYQWLSDLGEKENVKGFLDPNKSVLHNSKINLPILGREDTYNPEPQDVFVMAITDSNIKQKAINVLKTKNATFRSVIHPTALISEHSNVGMGVIIYPYALISCDATVGSYTVVTIGAVIGHDVTVGEYSYIGTNTVLAGWSRVGIGCYIGSNSVIAQRSTVEDGSKVSSNVTVFGKIKRGEIVMPARNRKALLQSPPEIQ